MSSSPPLPAQQAHLASPPITIILTVILLVSFFIAIFSIYFCKCFMESVLSTWNLGSPSGNNTNPNNNPPEFNGLDPALIEFFPTFYYSSVKEFRREKYGLECAICLSEFKNDDLLRLLTVCYHVFHEECIDLWFKSHKTCPVCRSDLDLPREVLENNTISSINGHSNQNSEVLDNDICIDVREEDDNEIENNNNNNNKRVAQKKDDQSDHENIGRFSRSHSTGHSMVMAREVEDKYTLRLPDHVKVKIIKGHDSTKSCITFGELSSLKNNDDSRGELGCSNIEDIHKVP